MGCSSGKMAQVVLSEAQTGVPPVADSKSDTKSSKGHEVMETEETQKRIVSAVSKRSERSQDSGLGEGDCDSLRSESSASTTRVKSGGLKRTLRNLSAKSSSVSSRRESESDILKELRSEGLLARDTCTAKSGMAFNLMDENDAPKRGMPARLAKLERKKKKRKLLTQQDIENKLQKAEERRKEAESERLEKIQAVAKIPALLVTKADADSPLAKYEESHKRLASQVLQKVEHATENRANRLRELREKLKAKDAHAARVRQRKISMSMNESNTDTTHDELPRPTAQS